MENNLILQRKDPLHFNSSISGKNLIRGSVYADGYYVWNETEKSWSRLSDTFTGTGSVNLSSLSAENFYIQSLTADQIYGNLVDDETIGINESNKLYVKGVNSSDIIYPFAMLSTTYSTSFTAESGSSVYYDTNFWFTSITGFENAPSISAMLTQISWSYNTNYLGWSGAEGVKTIYLISGNNNINYTFGSTGQTTWNFNDIIITGSRWYGNYEAKAWTITANVTAVDSYDNQVTWSINTTSYKYPPIYVLTAGTSIINITNIGPSETLVTWLNSNSGCNIARTGTAGRTSTISYTLASSYKNNDIRLYFILPKSYDSSGVSTIQINSAFGWQSVATTHEAWSSPDLQGSWNIPYLNGIEYIIIYTNNYYTPIDDYGLQYRISF